MISIGRLDQADLSPIPLLKTPARPEEVADIWKQWHESWAHDRALSSHRILRIELDEEDAEFIGKSSVPIKTRRRPALGMRYLAGLPHAERAAYAGAASVETKIAELCSRQRTPDIIFYAGRSAQFGAFIDALTKSGCSRSPCSPETAPPST